MSNDTEAPVTAIASLLTDALAQDIRTVDGSHSLGAGALAEALLAAPTLAALVADAERYRWVVQYGQPDDSDVDDNAWDALGGPYTKDYIDTAIDLARAARSPQ